MTFFFFYGILSTFIITKNLKGRKIKKSCIIHKRLWLQDDAILKAHSEFYECGIRAHLKIQTNLLTKCFFWKKKKFRAFQGNKKKSFLFWLFFFPLRN